MEGGPTTQLLAALRDSAIRLPPDPLGDILLAEKVVVSVKKANNGRAFKKPENKKERRLARKVPILGTLQDFKKIQAKNEATKQQLKHA